MAATTRVALVTGMTGLVFVASACGSSSRPSVASIGTTAATTSATVGQGSPASAGATSPSTYARWVAYNACLTDHGVPSITPKNGGSLLNGASTPNSMAAATAACRKLAPPGGTPTPQRFSEAKMKAFLTYAACMRKHGVPNYPDPKLVDNDHELILGQGVDFQSPLAQAALTACKDSYPE
jgi:hypothetical protein